MYYRIVMASKNGHLTTAHKTITRQKYLTKGPLTLESLYPQNFVGL